MNTKDRPAYRAGLSDSACEVPEPLKAIMRDNSAALDETTKKVGDSRSRKPSQDSCS